MRENAQISDLMGKTITHIERKGDEELIFTCSNGGVYRMYHEQSCCESVVLEDVIGELESLLNSPILRAEERTNKAEVRGDGYISPSLTWTFYELATLQGAVTLRWFGSSNGYYSEEVDFEKVNGR